MEFSFEEVMLIVSLIFILLNYIDSIYKKK